MLQQKDVGLKQMIKDQVTFLIYLFLKPNLEAFPACHAPMQFNETFPLAQGKLG